MKTLFLAVWQRRWCRMIVTATLLLPLPLLHPFIRQSIFGPRIQEIPWCVWEEEVRMTVHPDRDRSWFADAMEKVGLIQERRLAGLNLRGEATLPLHLHLADDGDPKVRAFALECLRELQKKHEAECEPIFRRHLQDDDPGCRVLALNGVWETSKDIELKSIAAPLLDERDESVRLRAAVIVGQMARTDPELKSLLVPLLGDRDESMRRSIVWILGELAPFNPDLFIPLAKAAEDPNLNMRAGAIHSMRCFGKRGVPIIRKGLRDPDRWVRAEAFGATEALGKDAEDLIPDLLAMCDDPNPHDRRNASHTLYRMDPKRFAKPATWVD